MRDAPTTLAMRAMRGVALLAAIVLALSGCGGTEIGTQNNCSTEADCTGRDHNEAGQGEDSSPKARATPSSPSADVGDEPTGQAALSLKITPDTGSRGSKATVEGEGFHPGERVRVTWGTYAATGKVLKDTEASEDGSFSAEVIIPPKRESIGDWDYDDEGTMRVVATGLTSEREADTYYRYTL